ncbi:hypothetical protein J5N97_001631 [Dioscorea zingiberensis]|uniref:MAR-binding filament-like protein 1-1 n=1 Tax=Dioscorea zingiberensis TaxID=325984 RepID=A0A9D5H283_9LILI|nr:hypothetical protein J5N97_001631 [Dioscorea zingiberensis]
MRRLLPPFLHPLLLLEHDARHPPDLPLPSQEMFFPDSSSAQDSEDHRFPGCKFRVRLYRNPGRYSRRRLRGSPGRGIRVGESATAERREKTIGRRCRSFHQVLVDRRKAAACRRAKGGGGEEMERREGKRVQESSYGGEELGFSSGNRDDPGRLDLADQEVTPGNPLVPFLNELGIIGSNCARLHYIPPLERKEKSAMESTIESMKAKQNEQEVAMTKLKEAFHARLLGEQEERKRQVNNLKQEEASLLNQLASANERIATLSQELEREKKLVEMFKAHKDDLEHVITKAGEDRKVLEARLKEKMDVVDVLNDKDLTRKINSLSAERDKTERTLRDLMDKFNDLKLSSEKRLAHDSELLTKKDDQLHQLQEKVAHALREIKDHQSVVHALTTERNDLKAKLEKEVNDREKLRKELQITQRASEASNLVASNLSKELEEVKKSYADLNSKVSEMQHVFSETKKSLNANLEEANSAINELSNNLFSVKEALRITKDELDAASNELKDVMKERETLKKELLEIYKKAEITAHELKEERNLVATLNRDLEVLGKQLLKDSEARRALESDLDEATKSLDEMNKSALLLSKELESTNSRTTSLETEKEMLFKSLIEQKDITKEAHENLEDAQNLITRLGSERENLEKRSKMLEDDLAAAKGEILRLRRQISARKESKHSTNEHSQSTEVSSTKKNTNNVPSGVPFPVKKTGGRRRKGDSTSDADQ